MMKPSTSEWHPTACILCECNCGIEIRLGADGRTFERTRGDKAHPASKGYTCEKALRLAHGGESIVYYGGGGQGNHLGGAYGSATLRALGVRYRASAISQEKTGE